jgi:hypothetical protein
LFARKLATMFEPFQQRLLETFHLVIIERVGLDRDSAMICGAVVHEPHGDRQRCQEIGDVIGHLLASIVVEAPAPVRENRRSPGRELNARISLSTEALIEFMECHREVALEGGAFEFGQRTMSCLVLDVQPRMMTMHRETTVTKQGSDENRFLVGREVDVE